MEKYNILFQGSEVLMVIQAKSNSEARRLFNKNISIRIRRCGVVDPI
jgi:hypothetical protein